VGRQIELPLTGRRIPIVADEHVDPTFGSGAVKVTPAHDPNDFEIGRRHGLPSLTVLDERGIVTVHGPFQGLDRFEARPAVVAALREEGRIIAEKRPYLHAVGHCQRCNTTVEPRLSMQWFVRVEPLAKAAGDAVRDGRVTVHPKDMEARYFAWVDNMHDWCISRQLWWGHRIPVWYGPDGEIVCVGPDEEVPAGDGWTQDPDVLDTWFSSALWPFSTLGWPDDSAELERFYPTSVLVTGYDILFFWVARMMMFGLYAMNDRGPDGAVPFRTVALHGMVRDQFGRKMSKSLGNVVDPLDWMDRFGADATRFTLARGANPGADVPTSEEWVQGSRNFCNKLWNVTRFALLNGARVGELPPLSELSIPDRWILSRLSAVVEGVDTMYEDFELGKAAEALYHFAWDEVCDWYVELAKTTLASGGSTARATQLVLGRVLDHLLRLLHPLMPFVTEQLWTALVVGSAGGSVAGAGQAPVDATASLVVAPWPSAEPTHWDPEAEARIAAVQEVVTEIRRFRAEQGLPPGRRVPAKIEYVAEATDGVVEHEAHICALARLDAAGEGFVPTASLTVKGVNVGVDLHGVIDVAAERARLEKDLAAARKDRDTALAKLANRDFTAKAPEQVVSKVRVRAAAAEADIGRLEAHLAALAT
jgi:valyl-tRNA synthetase